MFDYEKDEETTERYAYLNPAFSKESFTSGEYHLVEISQNSYLNISKRAILKNNLSKILSTYRNLDISWFKKSDKQLTTVLRNGYTCLL